MEDHRRGTKVALFGALIQLILAGVLMFLWQWTKSQSALVATITLAGGVLPWLMASVLFYCRQLRQQELLELEELAERRGEDASLFQGQDKSTHPAAARLAVLERWVVPLFTLVWAAFHAAVGILLLRYLTGQETAPEMTNTGAAALFSLLVVFVAFLFSRYSTGMAHEAVWRPLRATGSYLLACVLFVLASAVAMVAAWQGYTAIDGAVAKVVPVLQIVLAVELALNFILDLYRPRLPGEEHRLAFDSRLLNLLAEPERIGHSIAETLNYQFGFEVSKTWFYQLLSRSVVWLILFGVCVMFAMSCLVVVQSGEQAIVMHWGQFDPQHSILGPGLHVKWPWPVDTVRRFRVDRVHDIWLGTGSKRTKQELESRMVNGKTLYLWTEDHGVREEKDFIVAVPPERRQHEKGDDTNEQIPPVDIIKLVVLVQYRIKNVADYAFNYSDPHEMLTDAAQREMVQYCASASLQGQQGGESGGSTGGAEAMMTTGRQHAADELKRRIQKQADELKLGVEIAHVGLVTVHPPKDAAPAYEEVLAAERRRDKDRYNAQARANEILATAAGTPEKALGLAWKVQVRGELDTLNRAKTPAERQAQTLTALAAVDKKIQYTDRRLAHMKLMGNLTSSYKTLAALREEYANHQRMLVRVYLSSGPNPPTAAQREALQKRGFVPAKLVEAMAADPASYTPIDLAQGIRKAEKDASNRSTNASGEQAKLIAEARAQRWKVDLSERTRFLAAEGQHLAWNANPDLYQWDLWMDVWEEVLPRMNKYVLGVDKNKIEVWLNWERASQFMEGVNFQATPAKTEQD